MVLLIWVLRSIVTVSVGCLVVVILSDDGESDLLHRMCVAVAAALVLWGVWFFTEIGLENLEEGESFVVILTKGLMATGPLFL